MEKCRLFLFVLMIPLNLLHAQWGDPAQAEQYVLRAENALRQDRWSEAMTVLERGSDYADVSSDISYLLALAQTHFEFPRGSVLQALRRALEADRWTNYTPQDARILEAENLIALKFYQEALNVLALTDESPESGRLRLLAYRFDSRIDEFYRYMEECLNRYPRDSGIVRVFLDSLRVDGIEKIQPRAAKILEVILRRLPVLIPLDGELVWRAIPFMRDPEEATELIAAYRKVHAPVPASLPGALNLGLIDEKTALDELFIPQNRASGIDLTLIEQVWDLLGNEEGRETYRRYLSGFTGVITKDTNQDGIPEAAAVYLDGMRGSYRFDGRQNNLPELTIDFETGSPKIGKVALSPEAAPEMPIFPAKDEDLKRISVYWEKYPAVREAELAGERFLFRPQEFFFAPVQFMERDSVMAGNFPFPEKDSMASALTRHTLIAHCFQVERPSLEFPGAVEVVELNASIPVRAREYLNGRMISETDFLRGRPQIQRVDLDLDGHLETWRHFRRFSLVSEDGSLVLPETLLDYRRDYDYAESDWDGNGIFIREYFPNF